MTLQNTSTWRIRPFATDRFDSRYVMGMCALFAVLMLGRAVNNAMLYVFLGVALVAFTVSNPAHCAAFLFFLWPMATIIKPYVGSMSYYTVFFFLTIVKMVIAHRKIDLHLFVLVALFVAYRLAFNGTQGITTLITMASGILLLYYLRQENISLKTVIFAFTAGICMASCLAMLRQNLPVINGFIREAVLKTGQSEYATRFAGLTGNPNYFTMDVIMVQAALIVLMHREKKQTLYLICFGILTVFGFMSVSQSYLLAWILLVFLWFLLSLQKGISSVVRFFFIGILMLAVIAVFAFDYIELFVFRITQGVQGGASDFTTGRTDIWRDYLETLMSNVKMLIFGVGNSDFESIKKNTHNTYLEWIFHLGLVGTTLLLSGVRVAMGKFITSKIMWMPVLILLFRMLAIGIAFHDSLWFYLGLIVFLAQYCRENPVQDTPAEESAKDESSGLRSVSAILR